MEISQKIGISEETVRKKLHRLGVPLRTVAGLDEDFVRKRDKKIKRWYDAGVPWDVIYKRLGIDGEPKKGFTKNIKYNLGVNEIIYTESLEKEEKK